MGTDPALFARARAFKLARALTEAPLRWSGYAGADHVFLTPTGAEIRVDLVLRRATWFLA